MRQKRMKNGGYSDANASNRNVKSYAYTVKEKIEEIDNKLDLIPTEFEDGREVVIFEEELAREAEPDTLPIWVKLYNMPMEAWSVKGVSAIASSLGKPIIMDKVTAKMCHQGMGRGGYARVNTKENEGCSRSNNEEGFTPSNNIKKVKEGNYKERIWNGKNVNGKQQGKIRVKFRPIPKQADIRVEDIRVSNREKEQSGNKESIPEEKNMHVKEKNTPIKKVQSPKKSWNMQAKTMEEFRRSANKFVVFGEFEENEIQEIQKLREMEIIGKFVKNKRQPTTEDTSKWSKEMIKEFKDMWEEFMECKVRRKLWNILNEYKRVVADNPWVLMGDWNVSLNTCDHSEGSSCKTRGMIEFKDCVDLIEIEDLNSYRIHFTWIQSRLNPSNGILKKIDMIMGNASFIEKFDSSHAIFLPHLTYDHCPAVLVLPKTMHKKKRAFKFANYVADKPEFISIVQKEWSSQVQGCEMFKLVKNLKAMKEKLKYIQKKVDQEPHNADLKEAEAKILKEYNVAVQDEGKFLFQQATIDWLRDGDKNSKFFHAILKDRAHKSRVEVICNENRVSKEDAMHMIKPVSDSEIKIAMFDIDDNKAPGPDGYTSKFYKKDWDIVGRDVCNMDTLKEGLRQRDHIFPYIFTPVMEVFNLIMQKQIEEDNDIKSVEVVKNALDMFSLLSGLNPNLGKSTVFFRNIKDHIKQEILSILRFKVGRLPVTYLGVLLITKQIGINECKGLVDKVQIKVKSWKNEMLSYVGRLHLIVSVLSSIQIYWLQCDLSKGKAKVAWKQVCKPRDQGGLGIKDLGKWNEVLMSKHIWNIVSNKESLWVKWVNVGPLSDYIPKESIVAGNLCCEAKVADIVYNGKWKIPNTWLSKYHVLQNMPAPKLKQRCNDTFSWVENDGRRCRFSVKNTWNIMVQGDEKVRWYGLLWFSQCIPKHTFILWLAVQKRLSTQDRLARWYPSKTVSYSLCNECPNSHEHLFFECKYSKKVWEVMNKYMEQEDLN
ncbi:RNA-directed DNA polymerase, eukaryota, reverse transcriptase zinc-binding domain protein [Tanacetum coccineum]